jgi:hypothetical protein
VECSKFTAFITVALGCGKRHAGKKPMEKGRGGTRAHLKMEAGRRFYSLQAKPLTARYLNIRACFGVL